MLCVASLWFPPFALVLRLFLRWGTTDNNDNAKKAVEDEEKEEPCAICYEPLPNVGRGIVTCVSSLFLGSDPLLLPPLLLCPPLSFFVVTSLCYPLPASVWESKQSLES